MIPLLVDIRLQGAAQVADLSVAQALQVGHRLSHALRVVHPHMGHIGIAADMVVVEDGGRPAGLELMEPGVGQGQTQKQAAPVIAQHHIFVIVDGVLQLPVQGDDLHMVSGRLRRLAEADHQLIAEILRLLVFHAGNKEGDPGGFPAAGDPRVAQLHRLLQNGLPHGLADILGPVQRFGDRTLGYLQLSGNIIQGGHGYPFLPQIPFST